jgi:hypothetical protein
MKSSIAWVLASILGLLCLGVSPVARAQAEHEDAIVAEAREQFERGARLAAARRFDEAALAFERAHALVPHPATLYNLSQAYASSNRPAAAADALERYLTQAPSPEKRAAARAQLEALARRVARLELQVAPPTAQASLNDKTIPPDASGRPIVVEPGVHRIEVTLSGHTPFRTTVSVGAGSNTALAVTLEPAPPPVSARKDVQGADQRAGVAREPRERPRPPVRHVDSGLADRDRRGERRTWGVVLGGVGAALGLTTTLLVLNNQARFDRYEAERTRLAHLAQDGARDEELVHRTSANEDRNDTIQLVDRVSVATATAGALALATGTILFASSWSGEKSEVVLAAHGVAVRRSW